MPTIFVYEHITAMGWDRGPNPSPLGREGRAMRDAIVADFQRIPNVTITTNSSDCFDYALMIAPETEECLLNLVRPIEREKLLSCHTEGVSWCTHKDRLAALWQWHDVPTPRTVRMSVAEPLRFFRWPIVVKPIDGAGSGFRLCGNEPEYLIEIERLSHEGHQAILVQEYVSGLAASVAFLVNAHLREQVVPLWPCLQQFANDADHSYLGGELPLAEPLAERAIALGRRAIACVPGLHGYVGVDLILGDTASAAHDFAIEINPRLTTSYVGLRQLAEFNIAEAILSTCVGRELPQISWRNERIAFTSDGSFTPLGVGVADRQ